MKVEFVINGGIVVVLAPESDMEIEILKGLAKQNNDIVEVRTPINILAKTIRGSILICKKESLSSLKDSAPEKEKELVTTEKG